jgi:hypothetical protein
VNSLKAGAVNIVRLCSVDGYLILLVVVIQCLQQCLELSRNLIQFPQYLTVNK